MNTLSVEDGEAIAYEHIAGDMPGVLFCPGFHSDMQGGKALAIEAYCRAQGLQHTRFDYYGHGQSSGCIAQGSIGRWKDDTLRVLDEITSGPQIIVGSSMGAWMMLLAALARPERVAGLLGIASAPDMTQDLQARRMTDAQRRSLTHNGWFDLPNRYDDQIPYRVTKRMLDEAERHFVLGDNVDLKIPIQVPVRLVHGMQDTDAPWQRSKALMEQLASDDVELYLVKAGDHRLSSSEDLERLKRTLGSLVIAA